MTLSSSMSSLAAWKAKSSKFQKALNVINVLLLVLSLAMLGEASIMFKYYHLPKLGFWCHYFIWFPTTMLTLAIFMLLVSLYSIGVSCSPNSAELHYRIFVGVMAFLHGLAFFGTIFLVFCSLKLYNSIHYVDVTAREVMHHMELYGSDENIRSEWDQLQTNLRCCGGLEKGGGYNDWKNIISDSWNPNGHNVPDSCCLPEKGVTNMTGCGQEVLVDRNDDILRGAVMNKIWQNGCIWVLQTMIRADLGPKMWYYAGGGVIVILIELITVVLASAYIATLNRRIKRSTTMELN